MPRPIQRSVGIPRQRRAGEEVWRLRDPDGRVQSHHLRDDSRVDAGWDVQVLIDGETVISRGASMKTERGSSRGRSSRTTCALGGREGTRSRMQ
jgi:hypothetical protein